MLEKLSKDDKQWRRLAYSLCQNRDLADEIVQEMYIKMYNLSVKYPNKDINSWYVYSSLRTIYYDYLKQKGKTISLEDCFIINLSNDNDILNDRKLMNSALEELSMYDREILLHTQERSLRDNVDMLNDLVLDPDKKNMTLTKMYYAKKKALEKLLKTKGIKLLKKDKL